MLYKYTFTYCKYKYKMGSADSCPRSALVFMRIYSVHVYFQKVRARVARWFLWEYVRCISILYSLSRNYTFSSVSFPMIFFLETKSVDGVIIVFKNPW